jgi:hypothetical protein
MKEAAECNQRDVEEHLHESFQMLILFTLNRARTTQHMLRRIQQLMTCLNDANRTADEGDHLYSNFTHILK